VRGSDVVRDGMFLELVEDGTDPLQQLACIFYSDVTREFTLDYFDDSVPAAMLEEFVDAAVQLLPEKVDVEGTQRPDWSF
ncbi:hypothetical protein, partial [Pluralibacter gergoviae]|uniref:hypothetical protein n=1 Tax=Pluralibacter gergoviae TaxID=61647 RepID=UPI0027D8E066